MEAMYFVPLRNQLSERRQRLEKSIQISENPTKLINLLQEVDSALERMNTGTYGICEICHTAIEDERLNADPLVKVCLDCLDHDQKRRLEMDLEFASRIQRNLLPKENLAVPGWEFCYHYFPAGPVSGDFVDVIPLPDNAALFIIGDVSGKGIPAALMMSHLHALIHSLVSFNLKVNEMVDKINRLFCESTIYSNYATMVLGKVYPSGQLEITVAGHNPPLLYKNGNITQFKATGVPVGLFCDTDYGIATTVLDKDDALLLYTDGMTESALNEIEYGEKRLQEILEKACSKTAKEIIEELVNDQRTYLNGTSASDDVTLMVLKRA